MTNIIKTNFRAVKWVSKLSTGYFPAMVLSSLFDNLSPFVNIFMSAQIINEIAGNQSVVRLVWLVSVTLLINLVITIISTILVRINKYTEKKFNLSQTEEHIHKFLYSDYEQLEHGEIMIDHWHIWQASRVNGLGIASMLNSSRKLTDHIINIVLSVSGTASVIFIIINASGQIRGQVFIALLFVFMVAFVALSVRNSRVLAQLGEEIAAEGKKQNVVSDLFNAVSAYQAGKDYRIYDMKHIIDEYRQKKLDILKKNNIKYWYGQRNLQIPEVLLSHALNFTIYAFVGINALAGVFAIGGVVLYVGFIQRFVTAARSMATEISAFRMNIKFLDNYLNFYQVIKTTRQGTLSLKKIIISMK